MNRYSALPLLVATVASLSLPSCSPVAQDSYYQSTSSASPAPVASNALVGRWYDAYDWNGNQYTKVIEFYRNGTGSIVQDNRWGNGGTFRTASDIHWNPTSAGSWKVVESPPRVLAGEGRAGNSPFEYTARLMNGRLYDDGRKRTLVKADSPSQVTAKNNEMNLATQQLQQRRALMNDLSTMLSTASAIAARSNSDQSSFKPTGIDTTDITANYPEGYAYNVTTYVGQYAGDKYDFATIYGITTYATAVQNLEAGRRVYGGSEHSRFKIEKVRVTKGVPIKVGIVGLP